MVGNMSLLGRVRFDLLQEQLDAIAVAVVEKYFKDERDVVINEIGEEVYNKLARRGKMLITRKGLKVYANGNKEPGAEELQILPLNVSVFLA